MDNTEKITIEFERDPITRKVHRVLPEEVGYRGGSHQSDLDVSKIRTELPFDRFDPNQLPYARWGDLDNFPTYVRQQLEKVPLTLRALNRLVEMMYGEGIGYVDNAVLAKGGFEPHFTNEINDFMFDNAIATEWYAPQALEYLMFANAFSEAEQDYNGKITGLWHKTAEFCRLSQQSKKTGRIEYLIFSPEFQHNRTLTFKDGIDKNYIALPLFKFYDQKNFFESLRSTNFGFHTQHISSGTSYYARLLWFGLLLDKGWLSVAEIAPKQAWSMMKKQPILKYIITIPVNYFIFRHPEWDSYGAERRKDIIDKKIKEIEDYLNNNEDGNFKHFAQICDEDEATHEKVGKIEIEAVDDKVKNGTWIPDASVANLEILNALGLNPNQMQLANQQGKSMGAGSGSDSRVGYNTHILNNTLDQQKILYPLNVIARRNKWNVTFYIKHEPQVATNMDKSGIGESSKGKKPKKKASGINDGRDNGTVQ